MPYAKTTWAEAQGSNLNKFTLTIPGQAPVSVTLESEAVINAGTSFNVGVMQNMENGIEAAHIALDNMPYGYDVHLNFIPSASQLELWRILPLDGQVKLIANYPNLASLLVASHLNATADFWYRCDSAGNRTTSGAYMKIADKRGLFTRFMGQNSKYKMANDTPYDGKAIGEHIGDAIRNITGRFMFDKPGIATLRASVAVGAFYGYAYDYTATPQISGSVEIGNFVGFDASLQVPVAPEVRPGSTSVFVGVRY
jgi:hypothetical protein